MIWYILYPFRGTTEPPRLSPTHPLRRAFQAHGTATARHWLLSILLTIVISVLLCYPAVFQIDSPAAAGLRNLPKHVWTSTVEVADNRPAEVELRQVWVHGDYMKAIEPRILRQALYVQDRLIGDGFDKEGLGATTGENHHMFAPDHGGCLTKKQGSNWGIHSPLMYWDCSLKAIDEDPDLLATINSRTSQQSLLNLTLRPSTVFAGKAFSNNKLRAADALVITLFDKTNSTLAYAWETRSRQLALDVSPGWSMFPKDGQILRSRLYEFRFKPMTLNDDLFLAFSYLITAAYVVWRMMQLRAFKSWFGLLITICAKMTICVIGSFTICTFIGIDLARIPRPWFPGVVFCFGLGNIFRLINVVLETPPEMPPVQRIGNALGEVGHLSLAVAGQNLLLIWLCSRIVTPWVADFCVFAAVTLVLDFVYHLTFFLAVLSVDVQRMELQDSLARVDDQASKGGRQGRQSWLAALRQGTLPVSTRFAGSAAILSMILAVNWHFFDSSSRQLNPRAIVERLISRAPKISDTDLWGPPPINQARTPADWLRLQDHNTAREFFGFIKPNAHSFVARVYDPLLVVMSGAHGRDTSDKTTSLLESVRHFTQEHAFPAALLVVFLIAGVTLLMNYFLWTGLPVDAVEGEEDEDTLFSVKTLPTPQTLDVVRLSSCSKGHLASVSLDRSTSLWINERSRGYANAILQTGTMQPRLWPIVGSALDDNGRLLALCSDNGQVGLWSFAANAFLFFPKIELRGQVPILFYFISTHSGTEYDKLSLVIVTPDGYLTTVEARSGEHQTKRICSSSITSATIYACTKAGNSLVYVSRPGEVYILPLIDGQEWSAEVVAGLDPGPPPGSNPSKIRFVYGAPSLGLIFAIRTEEVEIFDFNSRALVYNLTVGYAKPSSFRVLHSPRRSCICGSPAVHTFTVAYTEQDTDHMLMQTFTLDDSASSQICLGKATENETAKCQGLSQATEAVYCVEPAGVWEPTGTLSIVGIRRCTQSPTPSSTASGVDSGYFAAEPSALASALKQRASTEGKPNGLLTSLDSALHSRHPPASPRDFDNWEAWALSATGEFRARPLVSDPSDEADPLISEEQLFVAAPGPITRLGKRSVAVGFGNTVKIITLGKESFDGITSVADGALDLGVGSYRKIRRGTGRKMQ